MSTETRTRLDIPVEGMTCASCAGRVEKSLNEIEGVDATVNFALKRATVEYDDGLTTHDDLAAAVEHAGYTPHMPDAHEHGAHMHADADALKRRVIVSGAITLPLFLVSMISTLQFDYWQWISMPLAFFVVLWGGWPIHRATWNNLKHRALSMDTLVTVGTFAALGYSTYNLIFGMAGEVGMLMTFELIPSREASDMHVYFEIAAVVTTLIMLGRYFEARATRRAGAAIEALLKLGAKDAAVLGDDGLESRVPIEHLQIGDHIVVRPGEKIATDGRVVEGTSAIDQSMLTGESVPFDVEPGDDVAGATINTSGRIVIEATRVGEETALAQIAKLVSDAQSGKSSSQRLADRVSAVFIPAVFLIAAGTLIYWLATGASTAFAVSTAVSVLVIACPCALGLATPTALMVGTGRGAQLGLLIKGPEVLEQVRTIETIVLDKTGTLTTGKMSMTDFVVADGEDHDAALRLVGAAEDGSEHPIAKAIAAAARESGGELPLPQSLMNHAGLGVEAMLDGTHIFVGRPALLEQNSIEAPTDELKRALDDARDAGRTAIVAGWDGKTRALAVVSDSVKPTAARAIQELTALGMTSVLLTGDNERTAAKVAEELGIDDYIGDVLPREKADKIASLKASSSVAMVGDGVNDAPALATADLGLAIGTGTDVAIESSDITIISGEPLAIVDAVRLSRSTLRTIQQNLGWAFGYNVLAIPLAVAGVLGPVVAGAAMAMSSISVVLNALRLRRFKPLPR
ncbi:MAG: copper-translocating P-type ATPase [Thermoleophilaceae bacterium]|nr:copper-translocating P-type ATPase [Thermoleophilaceae bacterium]